MDHLLRVYVVGNGAYGCGCSLMLSFETQGPRLCLPSKRGYLDSRDAQPPTARYMFNAGECLQRLSAQYRLKSAKVKAVFASRIHSEALGGLSGLTFALSDAGSEKLAIRGPLRIKEFASAFSDFIPRRWPEINIVNVESDSCHQAKFEDLGLLQVLYVALNDSPKIRSYKSPNYCHWCLIDRSETDSEISTSDSEDELSDSSHDCISNDVDDDEECPRSNDRVICFVVRCWTKIGCDKRTPVKENSVPLIIAFVDCPSINYIPSLTKSVHLSHKEDNSCSHSFDAVFHLSRKAVVEDPQYQNWVKSFRHSTRHIFAHVSNGIGDNLPPDPFCSSSRWTSCLRTVVPKLFPSTYADGDLVSTSGNQVIKHSRKTIAAGDTVSCGATQVPFFEFQRAENDLHSLVFDDSQSSSRLSQRAHLLSALKNMRSKLRDDPNEIEIDSIGHSHVAHEPKRLRTNPAQNPEIFFLGTGAAKPAKLRSCSAILVQLQGNGGYAMLDCGEGTFSQLIRLFGPEETSSIITKLRWIWISHHHLDHHGGLTSILEHFFMLLKAQPKDFEAKLRVFGPKSVLESLKRLIPIFGVSKDFENKVDLFLCQEISEHVFHAKACRVIHCRDSWAIGFPVLMTSQEKMSLPEAAWVVYSGDTRPCQRIWSTLSRPSSVDGIRYCSSILIHEATFDDSMLDQAIKKRHSTVGEALQMASSVNADVAILTHFSQRYPKLVQAKAKGNLVVLLASDLMSVPLQPDLTDLRHYSQALSDAISELDESEH